MITKNYVVIGKDVNDYMVMQSEAYLSYTLRLLYCFLFQNGFSKEKLNTLHLGFKEGTHRILSHQNLMFTEHFCIELKHCKIDDKIIVNSRFFNQKKECCTEVSIEFEWFDYVRSETIPTPKKILEHFKCRVA